MTSPPPSPSMSLTPAAAGVSSKQSRRRGSERTFSNSKTKYLAAPSHIGNQQSASSNQHPSGAVP
jgi:hypothetical protein